MSREEEKPEEARIAGKDALNLKGRLEEEHPFENPNLNFGREEENKDEGEDCKESDIFFPFVFVCERENR